MSWKETSLYVFDAYNDPRLETIHPIMSRVQQMRFAKQALEFTAGGRAAFNKVFGESVAANPGGQMKPIYTGVPGMSWIK